MTTTGSATLDHLRRVSERQAAQRVRTVNGQQTYRDTGSDERYSVGYGGERVYVNGPAPVKVDSTEASTAQKRLIDELLVERQYNALTVEVIEGIKKDKKQSTRFITYLLKLPKVEAKPVVEAPVEVVAPVRARLDFKSIADGNYALDLGDDRIKFYRVATGKNGFKNVQERASDTLYPVPWKAGIAILHKIVEAGLEESRMLFASKLERCWMCGRTLTDKESRELGIGPDCRNK